MNKPSPPLPVGVYELSQDVPNPGPRDKRTKNDWRDVETFKKGLLVRMAAQNHGDITIFEVEGWGRFGSIRRLRLNDPRFLALLPHLVPVRDFVTLLDEQIRQLTYGTSLGRYSDDVLEALLRSGEVRPERVVAIVTALRNKPSEG